MVMWNGGGPVDRRPDGTLPSCTSIGAYPVVYLTARADVLCAQCASDDGTSDPAVLAGIYYEGAPEICTDCGTEIQSAYGDPDGDGGPSGPRPL